MASESLNVVHAGQETTNPAVSSAAQSTTTAAEEDEDSCCDIPNFCKESTTGMLAREDEDDNSELAFDRSAPHSSHDVSAG